MFAVAAPLLGHGRGLGTTAAVAPHRHHGVGVGDPPPHHAGATGVDHLAVVLVVVTGVVVLPARESQSHPYYAGIPTICTAAPSLASM